MSGRSTNLLACSLALATAGCIEDGTLGLETAAVELPRGATHQVHLTSSGPLPPLTAFVLDVDDAGLASVTLSPDQRNILIHATGEGQTTVHLTYRETALHIPTTVLPAATVSIAIQPGGVTAPIGGLVSLAALATNTAGEIVDVTPRAIWTIDDPHVALLTSDGALRGSSAGTTSLRAELDGVAQTATVSVVPAN